jgi:hypothetical protein
MLQLPLRDTSPVVVPAPAVPPRHSYLVMTVSGDMMLSWCGDVVGGVDGSQSLARSDGVTLRCDVVVTCSDSDQWPPRSITRCPLCRRRRSAVQAADWQLPMLRLLPRAEAGQGVESYSGWVDASDRLVLA